MTGQRRVKNTQPHRRAAETIPPIKRGTDPPPNRAADVEQYRPMTRTTRLEDLKPSRTNDRVAPGECVTLQTVQWFGTDAVEVIYKRAAGNTNPCFPARGSSQMEARKPSNQTAHARTADARLKSAKPQRVRLLSLAARAVCGFLTIAAILTLPTQAQGQTTIWSSTLTVQNVTSGVLGCRAGIDSVTCSAYLSDDDFTYNRTTHRFLSIEQGPPNYLRIRFNEASEIGSQNLTLNVDGRNFAFEDAIDPVHPTVKRWNNAGLNWTGGDTVSLTLTDPDRSPGAPETPAAPDIGATEGSNTSLDIGWLEPASAGPFVKYYLRYRQETHVRWTDGPQNITTNFANITSLGDGTTYEVQVLASNNNGDSEWSPSGTGRTDSGEAPSAPASLNATANGQNRIDLSWTAPSAPNDPNDPPTRSYHIEIQSLTSNWLVLVVTTGNTDTEYSHRDVAAGVLRRYRVSAINTNGTGPPSNVDEATTDAADGGGAPTPDPQMQQSQTPLTASFVSVPPAHDGETPFWLELTFDAPVAQGSKPQLRELLDVTGGLESRFRRKDGRLDHWQIRVDPSSQNAVAVMLAPSPPCGESGAVCTDDGRTFTTGLATQIHGPASGNNWSDDATKTAVTPVPALPLAGIGLLGLLLALLGSRRRLNDHRQINTSRPSATEPPDSETS